MLECDSRRRSPLLVLHVGGRTAGGDLTAPNPPEIHAAHLDELTPRALLGILAVRQTVFVVEQQCVYPDIDWLDAAAHTVHLWIEDDAGTVVSTLRLMDDDAGRRIGRVATLPIARRRGHSSALVRHAIELSTPPIVLSAQAYLVDWYAGFGFEECGEHWIEDGIEHVPMRVDVRR